MKNLKYIFAILLILFFSSALLWAEDEKSTTATDEESSESTEEVDEAAASLAEDFFGDEVPDVIVLGQMLQQGLIDPVKSKAKRDNPFQPPDEEPVQAGPVGPRGIEPLPSPPMVGPAPADEPEKTIGDIAGSIKLVGIMEIAEGKKIAILDFGGRKKSLKVGEEYKGTVTLVVSEIGDDSVVLSMKDGSDKIWVGFSFSNPN
jgi:hypothetical protein